MTRMIPDFFDDSAPPGERDVFGWLTQGPVEWLVLHQLDLTPWNRSRRTEIDFVVIMPDTGILCIEVKSHECIWFESGVWRMGNDESSRGPLKQAEDAAKTLQRRIQNDHPEFGFIPIAKCVVFPRAHFDQPATIEYNKWELFDREHCLSLVEDRQFCNALRSSLQSTVANDPSLPRMRSGGIEEGQQETLLDFLRPVRVRTPGAKEARRERRRAVEEHLRVQQRPILQLAKNNPRIIVDGAAGTGKTL